MTWDTLAYARNVQNVNHDTVEEVRSRRVGRQKQIDVDGEERGSGGVGGYYNVLSRSLRVSAIIVALGDGPISEDMNAT